MKDEISIPPLHFYFSIHKPFVWIPYIRWNRELLWKDKYNTPRVEMLPELYILWLWFELRIVRGSDREWEWYLWFNNYPEFHDGTIKGAKNAYPWKMDGEYNYYPEKRKRNYEDRDQI